MSEALPTGDSNSPIQVNPAYTDPNVKSVDMVNPLISSASQDTRRSIDGVTEEAKKTAITKDPVAEYQEQQKAKKDGGKPATTLLDHELVEKRTAFSNTYMNSDGGETMRMFNAPVNYKPGGKGSWLPVKGTLKDDQQYNDAEAKKESLISRILPGKPFIKKGIHQDNGFLRTTFRPLGEEASSISFDQIGGFLITLLESNPQSNPTTGNYQDGTQYVKYTDAWKNTDVYYEQNNTGLKETINLRSKDVPTKFSFSHNGATLRFGYGTNGKKDGTVIAKLDNGNEITIPALAVFTKGGILDENAKLHYELDGNNLSVVVDSNWLNSQSDDKFPISIDPTYNWRGVSTSIPGGDWGEYWAYKSDGWSCPGSRSDCLMNVGSLNNNGPKAWRSMMHLPLTQVYGKRVIWANIYSERYCSAYGCPGYGGNKGYEVTWANCFGFHCYSGAPRAYGAIDWGGNFDSTALMQWISQNNVGDGWLMMKAQDEGDLGSWKSLSGARTFLDVQFEHLNLQSAIPILHEPAQNASIPVSRPTLKLSPVSDPDGDIIRYAFHLMDSKGNIVAHSGELDIYWWTIPDDVLVDGETYSWRGWVLERNASNQAVVESGWRPTETRNFTYDLRTGKDKTQTFDDVGPFSISLNKGNGYTGSASHSISAAGGSIGVSADYNTPSLTQQGLTGYYYNDTPSGRKLAITVRDANVDMAWGGYSPYPGTVQADNFAINWKGYFIAPQDGTYTFKSYADDTISLRINGVLQFDFGCCGWNTSGTNIVLKKGQAYPIDVWYAEATGYAAAHLEVITPDGATQRVPSSWLRTLPDPAAQDNQGLNAKFYQNTDTAANPSFAINDKTPLVFATKVPRVDINWGTGSLLPYDVGVYSDNMIVNYSGYVTIPVTGDYKFGGTSDDGMRIRLGGKEVTSLWTNHGPTDTWSATMRFEAGQIIPIQVDYFEGGGGAQVNLQWQGPAGNGVIPGTYLSSSARVIPRGWNLGIDPDGNIPYESLVVKSNGNAELVDSDGFTHVYSWTGSGYKPPINEDGYLIKNSDGSFTLTDVDGRVYSFSVEGIITSISSLPTHILY